MNNETADKILTQLQRLNKIEQVKMGLLRAEKHFADAIKEMIQEIDGILAIILQLQANGVKKMKGGDDVKGK